MQVTAATNRINCIGGSGQSCTGGVVPTYDTNGNMTYDGTNTLLFDAENRAVSATNQSASGTYTYDGNGLRVQKVSGGTTTVYLYSGSKAIAEYDGVGGIRTEYIYGGSSLVAKIGGGGLSNGGFEQGLTGWTTTGTVQLISDPTRAHSGNDYAQLSAQPNSRADVTMSQYVAVKPGDQITFGGWGYLESGSGCCTRWLLGTFDSNGHFLTTVTGSVSDITSASWTYSVGTYTVPSGTAYVQLDGQIYLPTTASVARFDDGFLSAGTSYYHQDHLSNRLVTDSAGNTLEQMGHYPFGDPWYNATNDKLYFTTYERDSESSNDYAQARFFRWLLGSFLSPDPLAGSISDPQSLNRYAYVEGDPINLVDPNGTCPGWGPFLKISHWGRCNADDWSGGNGFDDGGDYSFDYLFVQVDNSYAPMIIDRQYSYSSVNSSGPGGDSFEYITTVTETIYGPVYQGGLDLGSTGPFADPSEPIKPYQMRKPVVEILRANNDCSAWFNRGTGSAADVMSQVPILEYTPNDPFPDMPDGGTGSPGSPIRVNSLGRFYTDRYNTNKVGDVFAAGGPGAQITILLHELAHQILPPGFISDDGSTSGASDKNNLVVLQHCLSAINDKAISILQKKGLP